MDADERDDGFDVRCLPGRVPAVAMRVWDVRPRQASSALQRRSTSGSALGDVRPGDQHGERDIRGHGRLARPEKVEARRVGAETGRLPDCPEVVGVENAPCRPTAARWCGCVDERQWERREAQVLAVQPDVARPPAEGRGEDGFVAGPDSEGGLVRCQGAQDEDRRERAWDRAQKRRVLAALHVPAGNAYLEVEFAMLVRSFVTKERKRWAAAA